MTNKVIWVYNYKFGSIFGCPVSLVPFRRKVMKPQIVICSHPNPHLRAYHVNWKISQRPTVRFDRPLGESQEERLANLGEAGATVVREVLAAVGTTEVIISPSEIVVSKGPAFDWTEMEPTILASLKKTFGGNAEDVEVEDHSQGDPVKEEGNDLSGGKEEEEEEA